MRGVAFASTVVLSGAETDVWVIAEVEMGSRPTYGDPGDPPEASILAVRADEGPLWPKDIVDALDEPTLRALEREAIEYASEHVEAERMDADEHRWEVENDR